MQTVTSKSLLGLAFLLLFALTVGCDTLDDLNPFEDEKEVTAVIEEVGDDHVVAEGIRYLADDKTEYGGGYESLADVSVGDEAELEYKDRDDGSRALVEIELASADDDD